MKGTVRLLIIALLCRGSHGSNSNSNNNNYYKYGNYDDDHYSVQDYQQSLAVCDDSVVEVTSISVTCSSSRTFYYGNGHRNSPRCDYGDKATVSVSFNVNGDLESDVNIYMTMAAVTNGEILVSTQSMDLCESYVGSSCTTSGSYSFSQKLKLSSSGDGSDATKFVPSIQMAFSTSADGGYILGAVNIECEQWDEENPTYAHWTKAESVQLPPWQTFAFKYALLIGTCVLVAGFAGTIWANAYRPDDDGIEYHGNEDYRRSRLILD
jgi:hypothetical protein